MASKPFVSTKFNELKILMKSLSALESLDYAQCQWIYKQKKTDMTKNIYEQIALVAGR